MGMRDNVMISPYRDCILLQILWKPEQKASCLPVERLRGAGLEAGSVPGR